GAAIDGIGMLLLAVSTLGFMLGVTLFADPATSLASPLVLLPLLTAALATTLLALHLRRSPRAIIPAGFLFTRGFALVNVINLLYGDAVLGIFALIPLYAEVRYR